MVLSRTNDSQSGTKPEQRDLLLSPVKKDQGWAEQACEIRELAQLLESRIQSVESECQALWEEVRPSESCGSAQKQSWHCVLAAEEAAVEKEMSFLSTKLGSLEAAFAFSPKKPDPDPPIEAPPPDETPTPEEPPASPGSQPVSSQEAEQMESTDEPAGGDVGSVPSTETKESAERGKPRIEKHVSEQFHERVMNFQRSTAKGDQIPQITIFGASKIGIGRIQTA